MHITGIFKNPKSISIDSRTIKRDDAFIAIKGERFDGHDFVMDAFKKGARCALVSRNVRLPSRYKDRIITVGDTLRALGEIAKVHRAKFKIPVVAITGTNGKTTAKDMTSFVLSAGYKVLKNETSKNNLIGLSLTLLGLDKTHEIAVLEMGMNHRGEIKKLSEIAMPQIGVITNVGPSHLEFLGTLKNVFMAKMELLKSLCRKDTAVLNRDDVYLRKIKRLNCRKVYFGIERASAFQAEKIFYKGNKWFFSLGKNQIFELSILGRHNIYNALIAIAVAREFDMGFSTIRKRLKQYRPMAPMRLESKSVRGLKILDDCYNSNPLSMERALETLTDYKTNGKRIVVSGDMLELGTQAKIMHESIGERIAGMPIDFLITLGNLSKFVNESAKNRGMPNLYHAGSHRDAANFLAKVAREGDVVLIKGSRSMEMEKVIEKLK